jgi:hypothetical protein
VLLLLRPAGPGTATSTSTRSGLAHTQQTCEQPLPACACTGRACGLRLHMQAVAPAAVFAHPPRWDCMQNSALLLLVSCVISAPIVLLPSAAAAAGWLAPIPPALPHQAAWRPWRR